MPTIPKPSPFDRPPKPEYRQAVEKPAGIPPEIAGNGGNSRDFALNPDWRKCPAVLCEPALPPFSWQGPWGVRLQRPHQANAMRSRTTLIGHGLSALSSMPFRDLPQFMRKGYRGIHSNLGSCRNSRN